MLLATQLHEKRGGGGTVGHSHFDIIIQCRPVVMSRKILFTAYLVQHGCLRKKGQREGFDIQGRPVLMSTSIFLYYLVHRSFLQHSCMRKGGRDCLSFPGPSFLYKITKPFKILGDYEKCKHRCLYLLYMTRNCLLNWFLYIYSLTY